MADTGKLLDEALRAGKHVMLEGAQGTMLDLDHGTYPFVTSSTPVAGYALASAGVGPRSRRAGRRHHEGVRDPGGRRPVPDRGHRARRANGWASAATSSGRSPAGSDGADGSTRAVLRYAARLNGLTELCLTKLDVLSGFETVKVCVGYRAGGETWDDVPPNQTLFHEAEPI